MPLRRSTGLLIAVLAFVTASFSACSSMKAAPPGPTRAGLGPGRTLSSSGGSSSGTSSTGTTEAEPGSGPSGVRPPTLLAATRLRVITAWEDSVREFYEAGRLGQPTFGPLVDSFAPGSPAGPRTEAWIAALVATGVEAPATERIGNARVIRLGNGTAELTGCTYDTGAVYRDSGSPAPTNLGGGASYTASVAVLHLVGGRWLVWSDHASTLASNAGSGPCHDF